MSVSTPTYRARDARVITGRHVGMVLAVLAGILVIGAPGPWPAGRTAGQVDVALGPGNSFTPATITAHEGDVVVWTFDGKSHTVTSVGGPGQSWDSGKLSTGTYSHTFAKAGTYPYVCALHGGMDGTVVVLPAEAPAPTLGGPVTGTAPPVATTTAGTTTAAPASATHASSAPASTPAGPLGAAPPTISSLKLKVAGTRATAPIVASQPGTLTVRAGRRTLLNRAVTAGRQRVVVPLTKVRHRRVRLSFVLTTAAGDRSAGVGRTVTVR